MSTSTITSASSSIGGGGGGGGAGYTINLYEFLSEAELAQYYKGFKDILKVNAVSQLKYVTDEDLQQICMSRPEIRRLNKFFHKYYPQTYLRKIKKMILSKSSDEKKLSSSVVEPEHIEKSPVRVPSKHIISAESIVLNKELGTGEFGTVQQGVWTNDENRIQVAIKCLDKEHMNNNPMEFLKEAAIMHTIDHENIVRLYGVVLNANSLMLVTELAPLRSLLECLKEPALRPSFNIFTLCDFAIQICDGMQYLENKRLIHRDLAARNILVFSKNKVKISDFGLSRALGAGKDYYQTNFNLHLKLPIAWCAPECISYLRFTSASDVWAYGVTLWEMFSYGFQPWAALTGQQILDAIDVKKQHLEQPECCPNEYYHLMLKCWEHDPNGRPKFSELGALLPECKPEQVQAVKDYIEPNISPKKDQLFYRLGDVITVLDNHPVPEATNIWKGVLNSGKSGLFNPANTVAYLGVNMPSTKPNFTRPSSKNSVYSSKRKIRPELISGPQDDLKHTGHVGLDGAFFGDVSFLGDRQLPRQIVAPYKPQNDKEQMLTRASSDVSDRAPLLTKLSSSAGGKSGPASELWSDTASDFEKESVISINATNTNDDDAGINIKKLGRGSNGRPAPICLPPDHEYHEISDEENAWHSHTDTDLEEFGSVESPRFESLDFGPSLMDEVFKALDKSENEPNKIDQELLAEQQLNENNNVHNEIQEVLKNRDAVKKKQTVKPISASDQKTLDEAIAMANELASFSLQNIDGSEFDNRNDSPKTPSSPNKRKFSFKFPKNSPKAERRNFTEEAESITHIEESLSEGAKQAYTSLIEKTNASAICTVPISKRKPVPHEVISAPLSPTEDSNPLRMLRNGGSVMRPKVRGNKHNFTQMNNRSLRGTAERANLGTPPPPPPSPPPSQTEDMESSPNKVAAIIQSLNKSSGAQNESQNESNESDNPLPLPPRDRTKILPTYVPRQRKHPLVLAQADSVEKKTNESFEDDDTGVETTQKQNSAETTETVENFVNESNESIKVSTSFRKKTSLTPPPKPPRTSSLDESFEKKIEAQIDSLDEIPDEDAPCPPMQKHNDHVSCEDLLDFALDKPNAKRTQGRSRGIDSDEVRIMIKVLAGGVSAEECLAALNEVEWDVHKAIKYVKLHLLLSANSVSLDNCKQTLINCEWDVQRAASHLFNSNSTGVIEDTTEV